MPKSWTEKLHTSNGLPRVDVLSGPHRKKYGDGTMLIPAPLQVEAIMRQVPRGKLITINDIRNHLAHAHGATIACPITTGIFAWITAQAAEEAAAAGKKRITPYWRTLKTGGELNAKYPGGLERLRARLEAEGHEVVPQGRKWVVNGYERCLAKLKREAS